MSPQEFELKTLLFIVNALDTDEGINDEQVALAQEILDSCSNNQELANNISEQIDKDYFDEVYFHYLNEEEGLAFKSEIKTLLCSLD